LRRQMPAGQWKTCLIVPLHHIRDEPWLRSMTTRAILPQLTPVYICMTGNAVAWEFREFQSLMTCNALSAFMPPGQCKTETGMVERRFLFHTPWISFMAILAGNINGAMRRILGVSGPDRKQQGNQNQYVPGAMHSYGNCNNFAPDDERFGDIPLCNWTKSANLAMCGTVRIASTCSDGYQSRF
jgi:hypothetical protein